MSEEEQLRRENEKLKSTVFYEQVRAKNLADRAQTELEVLKSKSNWVLAFALVLLLCSVVIIAIL